MGKIDATAETFTRIPYFAQWIEELGREPADAESLHIDGELRETGLYMDTQWKTFEPTDNLMAGITFKDGTFVSRSEQRSNHAIFMVN